MNTPRTDARYAAMLELPWGSVVEFPKGHTPTDPWELCRELEENVRRLKGQLELCVQHLEGVSRRDVRERGRHELCLQSSNRALSELNFAEKNYRGRDGL